MAALAIGVGGAVGALTRYASDRLIEHHLAVTFPWSTFLINVFGFLAGLAVTAVVDRHHEPSWVGLGLVTGFLGSYTTYSTFHRRPITWGRRTCRGRC